MKRILLTVGIGMLCGAGMIAASRSYDASAAVSDSRSALKAVSEFANVQDKQARSIALFEEAGKVIQSPRCLNCHPVTDRPRQGDDMHLHEPPVQRGAGGMGAPGMRCV